MSAIYVLCRTWRLKDICYAPSIPNFEEQYIEQVILLLIILNKHMNDASSRSYLTFE